jgi:hypothetical protein
MADVDTASSWLVASNGRKFDSDGAFAVNDEIDWSETASARIRLGDMVLLYGTRPISSLTHQCRVIETEIPFSRVIDDREFWRDPDALEARRVRSWMRLRLERTFSMVEREALTLSALLAHGLRAAPQGRMKAPAGVLQLISDVGALAAGGSDDVAAEALDVDAVWVNHFRRSIAEGTYAVPDRVGLAKQRGSAQQAFAEVVKRNYGHRCAVTGIRTREFLVASHIVPWAVDPMIRLDPGNGICLSTLVDRAFDTGYIWIDEARRVRVVRSRLRYDSELQALLDTFDGKHLLTPLHFEPRAEYLSRRRAMLQRVS